jgi:uncharacterized membrane-anchored protein
LSALWRQPLAAKVPEVAALFWVTKVVTTGIGESSSDFLGGKSIPLAAAIGTLGLALGMSLQLRATAYRAPVYWFAVLMVAVFGTMAADGLHKGAGIPYAASTAMCAIAVAVIFAAWHRVEGTLDIHSITTRRREAFYWLAVLATFALGTAAGDLTAFTLNLGFRGSIVVFAGLMAVPAIAWWKFKLDAVVAFWAAYVITRPLGASVADWLAKAPARTGLGVGDGVVSETGLLLFAALVAFIAVRRTDIQRPRGPRRSPLPQRTRNASDETFETSATEPQPAHG